MPVFLPESIKPQFKIPLSRVELHVHLDGACRHETVWELSKAKNLPLPGKGDLKDLTEELYIHKPQDLAHFLSKFLYLNPPFAGDLKALEKMAYEFAEDSSMNGIAYVESRFCPQLLLNKDKYPEVSGEDVLKAVLKGFLRGEQEFGIKIRTILACIHGKEEFDKEILQLCAKYKGEGVVGIDQAGGEKRVVGPDGKTRSSSVITIFQEAKRLGIHRTVHAGEEGPPASITEAVESMFAERIGHGYRIFEDMKVYQDCVSKGIHFETCPRSSYLTGSVPLFALPHPIVRFAEDGANFSINSDDSSVTGGGLEKDYELVRSWGMNEVHILRSVFNAARSSFLPEYEKNSLIKNLKYVYGIEE